MDLQKQQKKILVAMSGGVDSSVAAALLVADGYEVVGAFMKQWSDSKEMDGVCSWKEDRRDALRVAAKLDIPLITLDFEKEYKEWVMGYMFKEYELGRTPNPDVLCNKYIKFGYWLDKARELGFDYLATGHYACLEIKDISIKKQAITNYPSNSAGRQLPITKLLQAKDLEKDQTYFLHQLSQDQLWHVLFPIGDYTKAEVRDLAKKFDLPTAERKESMGICFVGEVPMKEFLQQKIKPTPGNIVTSDGKVIGEHEGLAFYTIGQRHGFHLSLRAKRSNPMEEASEDGIAASLPLAAPRDDSQPLYVAEKRSETNELVVGFEDDPLLWRKEIAVTDVHWISGQAPTFPLQCTVRLRHRQSLQKCQVKNQKSKVVIDFEEPQKAVTPGQFAVFYKDGECLGGGVIQ